MNYTSGTGAQNSDIRGHELSLLELVESLDTDLKEGLKSSDAVKRLKLYGENIVESVKPSIWKVYLAPLFDVLILIYLVMTGILFILTIWYPSIKGQVVFWFGIIFFNMALAIFQQFRAQKKLETLKQLAPSMSVTVRDGRKQQILTSELVPGDVVELKTGDVIPAECRIISSSQLKVNESNLTGESNTVSKVEDGTAPITDDQYSVSFPNMVYLGTFITRGVATVLVVRTGANTEIGKIAREMSQLQTNEIPLRSRVNSLGTKLGYVVVMFLFLSITSKLYQRYSEGVSFTSETIATDVGDSVVIAMSIMPINIPLLTTIVLITGVLNMSKTNVIVKDLSVIETLGRTSVLCSDKTGTMTTSQMSVSKIWDTENYYTIHTDRQGKLTVSLMEPDGNPTIESFPADFDLIVPGSSLELLITSTTLNNDANVFMEKFYQKDKLVSWAAAGNPTDSALLAFSYKTQFNEYELRQRYHVLKEYPFSSQEKRMSKLFKDTRENDYMVFSKGASEVIVERCTHIGNETYTVHPLSEAKKAEILEDIRRWESQGYRVVSVAYKAFHDCPEFKCLDDERVWMEDELTYIGFVCLLDPPRPGVRHAVAKLDAAGIFPIMITGDAVTTAATIAKDVGILDEDEIVIEGKDIEKLKDEDFFKVSVFARVSPKDKQIIIEKYQDRGEVVAMTGDGVNDALAITMADAGVAMGITGTDVAKEAADLIIADDSYVSIVTGIEEGRALYEKIRMIIFFFIAVNIAEGMVYFFTSFFPDFFLVNNYQRAYIFSIMHGIPPLLLIIDSLAKDTMKLKPRVHDAIINVNLAYAMILYATTLSMMLIIGYFTVLFEYVPVTASNLWGVQPHIGGDRLSSINLSQAKARTYFVSIVYVSESLLIFSIRRINQNFFESMKDAQFKVFFFAALGPLFHMFVMYVYPVQEAVSNNVGFSVEILPLGFFDWALVSLLAMIPILVLEFYKRRVRTRYNQF